MTLDTAQKILAEFGEYGWEGELRRYVVERLLGDRASMLGRSIRARQTGQY